MIVRFLQGPEDPAFVQVLRIYHQAFPVETREPDERLIQELRGEYRLPFRFLVVEETEVLAFARFCRVPGESFGFLIHIAVDKRARGRGIGSELLRKVVEEAGPILAEIDREGPVRRWYEREGFFAITETYTQPSVRPDTPPMPFALVGSNGADGLGIPSDLVARFYKAVWELEVDHPFVATASSSTENQE